MNRRMLWVSLPDQRPRRELYWMSRMPHTDVTALAAHKPDGDIRWVPATYRRPVKSFIEAGALAWVRGLGEQRHEDFDWITSLELCSLVTGQAARWQESSRGVRRPRRAVITWENLPDQPLYKVPFYRQAVDSCRNADLLLCMVDASREHLLANGFDDERIRVVKPGVDTDVFHPAEEAVAEPRVVFTSPLAENKGIDRLLDAMQLVRRSVPEARLTVAGRGPLEPLVAAAAGDSRSGIDFVGALDTQGVASALRSAAVFATAPRPTWKWTEQLGLAYLEAMASGLPVVTTLCGTNDEAVTPDNSLVDDDVEAIADALVKLLKDPAERARVGAQNREHIMSAHDLETQCARMEDAFREFEVD